MSILRTLAPSFANKAANGLPTTSDRLITVTTFPRALSPYSNILLYTPKCSSTLTIASGVQGRMDLMVPGGAGSSVPGKEGFEGVGRWEEGMGRRVRGETKRILGMSALALEGG